MKRFLILLLHLEFVACGTDDAPDFCSELGNAAGCNGDETRHTCEAALEDAREEACFPHVEALAECLTSTELSCTSPTSIAAVGDGMFGGSTNSTRISGFDVVVEDSMCDVHRLGLEACRTCPEAPGAGEIGVRGIGEKCDVTVFDDGTEGSNCASSTVCYHGICTRYCEDDDDCAARADGCMLHSDAPNVCVAAQCTVSCSDDDSCKAWIGNASECRLGACTIP